MTNFQINNSILLLFVAIITIMPIANPTSIGKQTDPADNALAAANEITGFDKSISFSDSMVLVKAIDSIDNDKTFFYYNKINHKRVWLVEYHNITIKRGEKSAIRDFEVLIDPSDYKLLSVYSLSEEVGRSDTLPQPDPQKTGIPGKIIGPPTNAPVKTLLDILNSEMMGNPITSKIIRAFCGQYEYLGYHFECAWFIMLRGEVDHLPVLGGDNNDVPESTLNSHLYIYSGKTGELICMINGPFEN